MKPTAPSDVFFEEIPMPWGLRDIFYGSVLVMLAALVLPTFFPDEDLVGWKVWPYYIGMTLGLIAMFFCGSLVPKADRLGRRHLSRLRIRKIPKTL